MRGLFWLLKKYHAVMVFIILEALALLLLSNHNAYQRSVLVNANREVSGWIYSLVEGGREYLHLKKNNAALVRENTLLRNKMESISRSGVDTTGIKLNDGKYYYIPGRIVQSSHLKQHNYLTVDKGRNHGVASDMAVISDEGIVGIVLESSANFSTVIPVINRDFRLSVKTGKENYSGILQWNGDSHRIASLTEIPYHAVLSEGDTILTSGFSAIFPEGLFVGTIRDFTLQEGNFYKIEVLLGTDFQRLFHVNIIENHLRDEQVELENMLNDD